MNCKQGDLAIIVRGQSAGVIVRCISYVGRPDLIRGWSERDDCWIVDREVPWKFGPESFVPDGWMRPIRDTDKPDEIVARVPKQVTA